MNWNYNNPGQSWSYYPGIEKYLTNRNWDHEAWYGKTLATKIIDPNYQDFIVNVMIDKNKLHKSDGTMLDWWGNNHQSSSGYSKHQVRHGSNCNSKKIKSKNWP